MYRRILVARHFLFLLCFLLAMTCCEAREIKVFKLNYADPHSVANVITSLFGKQVSVAPATSINAVVVNAGDGQLLDEIARLVAVLDRRPATLRFTMKRDEDRASDNSDLNWANSLPSVRQTTIQQRSSTARTVTALEFAKASITDEVVRVFALPAWPDQQTVLLTTSQGLKISGHLTDQDQVLVQLWFGEGTGMETESLLTELAVPAGVWFSIGGLNNAGTSVGTNAGVSSGNQVEVGRKKTGNQIDRRFLLKVDVIR